MRDSMYVWSAYTLHMYASRRAADRCEHHAGLLEHESNAAVAGGVNIMLSAKTTAGICQLQALSVVGRCRTFDSRCVRRPSQHNCSILLRGKLKHIVQEHRKARHTCSGIKQRSHCPKSVSAAVQR